ncbi:MAG: amidohydrolase family protein [Ruminococcus sp.]|nr:amidohydrolase family protein [Ruminococcus sp.]
MIIKGNIIYMKSKDEMCSVKDGYLSVRGGIVENVYTSREFEKISCPGEEIFDYKNKLVIPGMTDLHLHASQYGFCGLGTDAELMDWLERYAFEEEKKFSDINYAEDIYTRFADDLLMSPTTRACIFTTVHAESSLMLAEIMEKRGFAAYIGKVNMDRNCPDGLREDTARSAADTREFTEKISARCKNVKPIITPRFIPSCTDELMKELSALRREYGLPVQSHLSENPDEIEAVKRLNPNAKFYGDAYDMFGLFGRDHKAVMAHCVYSGIEERALMRRNGVYMAHCPNSNFSLSSGIAPLRKFLDEGVNVGLGTDIAGGFSISMFRAVQDAVAVSKMLWRLKDSSPDPITFNEAFYLATMGGGGFFGKTGSFLNGYEADILVLDDKAEQYPVPDDPVSRLKRICFLSEKNSVYAKYIKGKLVMIKAE